MTMKLNDGFKTPVAVVDWIAFQVKLEKNSNGWSLKKAYEKFGVTHARALNHGPGGAASDFEIRMQHPASYDLIEKLLSDLANAYGLASEPSLVATEVSIDFFHQTSDLEALKAMTERLMRAITPPNVHNPRLIGKAFDTSCPIKKGHDVEKTLYIGNRHDDLMWRVYLKRTDDTFIGEDCERLPKPLPQSDCRARVEVCLRGQALTGLGLNKLSDLRGFQYERLYSARLFRFTKRNLASGPIFKTEVTKLAAKSLGITDNSAAWVLSKYGLLDGRRRKRKLSRHLVTDKELGEASRNALRRLTSRF